MIQYFTVDIIPKRSWSIDLSRSTNFYFYKIAIVFYINSNPEEFNFYQLEDVKFYILSAPVFLIISRMLNKINDKIPETLCNFLQELVRKN